MFTVEVRVRMEDRKSVVIGTRRRQWGFTVEGEGKTSSRMVVRRAQGSWGLRGVRRESGPLE